MGKRLSKELKSGDRLGVFEEEVSMAGAGCLREKRRR